MLSFVIGSIFSSKSSAQFRNNSLPKPVISPNAIAGELEFFRQPLSSEDKDIPGFDQDATVIKPSHKSSLLAAVLSLALPGLGEYYVGDQIWRGLIFTALDAGLWFERYHFLGRGDDSTLAFHAFADSLWLPSRYADTLNTLLAKAKNGYQVTGDPNAADYFSKIRQAEDSVRRIYGDNGVFPLSHSIPDRGTQQYYELISKYVQFKFGWKDFTAGTAGFSPDYDRHAFMRENMNHQYEVADYFLYGLFLNRILSAIDAVLLAKDHNSPVHLEGELQQKRYLDGTMGFIPTAHLRYTF